jgi:hypothetical protein
MAATVTTLPDSDALKGRFTVTEMSKLLIPQLPDGVDPTMMQLAYGRGAIPKMVRDLLIQGEEFVESCYLYRSISIET